MPLARTAPTLARKSLRILLCVAAFLLLFSLYTWGISRNPPGIYLDESAAAYNAYLVSRTGAGEFGPRFPLIFQEFSVSNPTYVNSLSIYLMAIVFRFLPPSIALARTFAAFWMFAACLLLGVLAKRISGKPKIGIIVAGTCATDALVLRDRPTDLGSAFHCFHGCPVPACRLPTFNPRKRGTGRYSIVAGSLAVVTYGYLQPDASWHPCSR